MAKAIAKPTIEIERVPLAELIPDPRNARKHDAKNLKAIAASLKRFGQRRALVVNRATKIIEAGNGVYLAAKKLRWKSIDVQFVEDDEAAALAFAIADNRTGDLSQFDPDTLALQLPGLAEQFPDLYEDLSLGDLAGEEKKEVSFQAGEESDPAEEETVAESWNLVVVCKDEADQQALYDRLTAEGRQCRPLTL